MEGVNLKYNVTAEVLTPLSVGQGSEKDWVEGIDYVVKNDMMYHLDLSKMFAAGIDMERVANLFQKQDAKGVRLLIGEKLEQVSDFKMPMTCHSSNPIKTFFRNQLTNRPVIPGSSLKGAIRSVLFTYLRDNERDNASVFGSMKDGSDFMRFIRVGDFEFPARSTELVNTKIYNLEQSQRAWRGAWKHSAHETTSDFDEYGFNTIYECLPFGTKTNGSIMLAKHLFDLLLTQQIAISHQDKKQLILNNPKEYLCRIINEHTKRYLEKELQFFKKYSRLMLQSSGFCVLYTNRKHRQAAPKPKPMTSEEFNNEFLHLKDAAFRYAVALLHNYVAAEDATQDLYEKLWRRRLLIRKNGFQALVMTSMRNLCLDRLRHNRSRPLKISPRTLLLRLTATGTWLIWYKGL